MLRGGFVSREQTRGSGLRTDQGCTEDSIWMLILFGGKEMFYLGQEAMPLKYSVKTYCYDVVP